MDGVMVFGFYITLLFGGIHMCNSKQAEYENTHKRVCEKIVDVKSCTRFLEDTTCIVKVESGKFVTIGSPKGITEACWDEEIK